MRGELAAVMEARFRPHREGVGQTVRRNAHALGREAIHRVRLVGGAHHERSEGQFHSLRRIALEDVAVERIEGEERLVELPRRADLREQPALRRFRIDIVEMRKVGGIFQIAESGNAVALGILRDGDAGRQNARNGKSGCRAGGHFQHIAARGFFHDRVPAFAALSASHHHTVGNAESPYFGNGSGRPKRSQRAERTLP